MAAEFSTPVDLPISSDYGPRSSGFHYGIDYSDGVEGHAIHAVGDGVCVYAAYEGGGLGHTATIEHYPGMKSGYGHMRAPSPLRVGQHVARGDVVGYVGNTGSSTGPHLHLWMGANTTTGSIDPATVLGPFTGDDDMPLSDDDIRKVSDMTRDKVVAWLNAAGTGPGLGDVGDTWTTSLDVVRQNWNSLAEIKAALGVREVPGDDDPAAT